jgi:hypothetical protein
MTELTDTAAWLVSGAGVLLATLAFAVTRRLTVAAPVLLDLLMAAGLMRLGADAPWAAIATAAAIVLLRKLVVTGLRVAAHEQQLYRPHP